MSDEMQSHHSHGGGILSSRSGLVMLGFLAVGGILLFTEHRAHVLGVLPYLLLLACPLMHFMHGGHGGHQHHHGEEQKAPDQKTSAGAPQ